MKKEDQASCGQTKGRRRSRPAAAFMLSLVLGSTWWELSRLLFACAEVVLKSAFQLLVRPGSLRLRLPSLPASQPPSLLAKVSLPSIPAKVSLLARVCFTASEAPAIFLLSSTSTAEQLNTHYFLISSRTHHLINLTAQHLFPKKLLPSNPNQAKKACTEKEHSCWFGDGGCAVIIVKCEC